MEFDDIVKVWDSQRNETMYTINEKAMHKQIRSRKQSAIRIANFSEILLIIGNLCTGSFILLMNEKNTNIFMYVMAGFMMLTAGYVWRERQRRKKRENKFDSSMLADLDHAIATARYQVTLSQTGRWYGFIIAILCVLIMWQSGKANIATFGMVVLFTAAFFVSRWEHGCYVRRQRNLELLRHKLVDDDASDL